MVAGLGCAAQLKASNFFQGHDPSPGPQRGGGISQSEAGGAPQLRGVPQGPASPPEGPPALSFSPFLLQLARVDNRPLTSPGSWAPWMLFQRKRKMELGLQSSVGSETP